MNEFSSEIHQPRTTYSENKPYDWDSLERLPIALAVLDAYGIITYVNAAYCDLTGFSKEEVVGQAARSVASAPEDAAMLDRARQEIRDTGRWEADIWQRHRSGARMLQHIKLLASYDRSGAVTQYTLILHDVTNRQQDAEKLTWLMYYDPLTTLPNRRSISESLDAAIAGAVRDGMLLSLLCFDLDHFKQINDLHGHDLGDQVLIACVQRMQSCLSGRYTLARWSGDEFIVVLYDVTSQDEALAVAEQLRTGFLHPIACQGQEFRITLSLGVSVASGQYIQGKALLSHAELALSQAKQSGKNCIVLYAPKIQEERVRRMDMERGIARGLQENEFMLHFQPKTSLSDGQTNGVEALLRWLHPERGWVSPGEFIPIAEETGQILELGEYVLRSACEQGMAWIRAGHPPMRIAINLSAKQCIYPYLVDMILQILQETGFSPSNLELELTESALMNVEHTTRILRDLQSLGIRVAIDDFGTGYSSLRYLQALPIHCLKIDRSFVQNMTDDASDAIIVKAVIQLAHSLGLSVVAEGVETQAQWEALRTYGCDEVQGYLICRPLSSEHLSRWAWQK